MPKNRLHSLDQTFDTWQVDFRQAGVLGPVLIVVSTTHGHVVALEMHTGRPSPSTFSSRGICGTPRSGPTIVAPGEDLIGGWIMEKRKSQEQIKRDEDRITYATLARQTGRRFEGLDLSSIRQMSTVKSGTSQACAYVSGLLAKFVEMRKSLSLPHGSSEALAFLDRVAQRIENCGEYEQGFGFVTDQTIQSYFGAVQQDDPYWGGAVVGFEQSWNNASGSGVSIAVLDTGMPNHPHIEIKDAVDFTNSASGVWDKNGHSTHVIGIIGSR